MTEPQHPFKFGYFPRNKYKDLVFYVKTGECSNQGLFEMPDTEENRALMDALASHSNIHSEREKVPDTDSILAILKARYRSEMAILDYIEMIECEVMALRKQVGSEDYYDSENYHALQYARGVRDPDEESDE